MPNLRQAHRQECKARLGLVGLPEALICLHVEQAETDYVNAYLFIITTIERKIIIPKT